MFSREYCEIFKNSFLIEHLWWLRFFCPENGPNRLQLCISQHQWASTSILPLHDLPQILQNFWTQFETCPKKMSSFKPCNGDQPLVVCVVVVSKFDPGLLIPISLCLNSLENNFRLFINFILGKMLTVTL